MVDNATDSIGTDITLTVVEKKISLKQPPRYLRNTERISNESIISGRELSLLGIFLSKLGIKMQSSMACNWAFAQN